LARNAEQAVAKSPFPQTCPFIIDKVSKMLVSQTLPPTGETAGYKNAAAK
jgi:hypothetical protein